MSPTALDALAQIPAKRQALDAEERALIIEARLHDNASWDAIGQALDMTRQAAHERFSSLPELQLEALARKLNRSERQSA